MDTDESVPQYQYKPLGSPDETRVIVLQPAIDSTSPLFVSIKQAKLSELTDTYEALSYTWGTPNLVYALHCNRAQILFTKSLDQALRRLRLKVDTRTLWADGVCINQADEHDKATQIPQMLKIFQQASRVVVFLGIGVGSEEEDTVKRLSRLSRSNHENLQRTWDEVWIEKYPSQIVERIEKLLDLSWFQRMWIIQEVVSNVEVVLYCGATQIQWPRFYIALRMFRDYLGGAEEIGSQILPILKTPSMAAIDKRLAGITQMFALWKMHGKFEIFGDENRDIAKTKRKQRSAGEVFKLLNEFAHHQCSDDRDRLFALVGLATDVNTSLFTPPELVTAFNVDSCIRAIPVRIDYTVDVRQTYQRFAADAIRSRHITEIFHSKAIRGRFENRNHWPTWVPDWRQIPSIPAVGVRFQEQHFKIVQLSRDKATFEVKSRRRNFLNVIKGPDCSDFGDSTCRDFLFATLKFFEEIGWDRVILADRLSTLWKSMVMIHPDYSEMIDITKHNTYRDLLEVWSHGGEPSKHLINIVSESMKGRCILTTDAEDKGISLGLGTAALKTNDLLIISTQSSLDKLASPALVVRPTGSPEEYELVGDASICDKSHWDYNPRSLFPSTEWHTYTHVFTLI